MRSGCSPGISLPSFPFPPFSFHHSRQSSDSYRMTNGRGYEKRDATFAMDPDPFPDLGFSSRPSPAKKERPPTPIFFNKFNGESIESRQIRAPTRKRHSQMRVLPREQRRRSLSHLLLKQEQTKVTFLFSFQLLKQNRDALLQA